MALLCLGILLFSFPILSLASRELTVGGIPVLFAYCFLVWALLIVLIAFVAESKQDGGPAESALRDRSRRQLELSGDTEGTSR